MIYSQTPPVKFSLLKGSHLQLSGVGFKSFTTKHRSLVQIGYSHYLLLRRLEGDLVRAKRQNMLVHPGDSGRSNLSYRFQQMKQPDPYKARGIYPVNNAPKLKPGKRR